MRRLLLILFALTFGASRAHAAPRLEGSPRTAHTGDVLHFTWSDLPSSVREVELELSLDGGRWVRLSPEMEAHEGGYDWRVPTSALGIARVRLRVGGEWFEHIAAESRAFQILGAGPPTRPTAGAEWWGVEDTGRQLPRREITMRHDLAPGALDAEEDGRTALKPTAGITSHRVLGHDCVALPMLASVRGARSTRILPLRI
jgi:hypothetical protein